MNQLANKVAIITGASSGIGYETSKLFAAEGAAVVIGARRKAELEALAVEIELAGGKVRMLAGDVRDESYARALVATATNAFGGLDIAFNNAGELGELGDMPSMSVSSWTQTLETNLTSAFLGARFQLPAMLKRGGGSLIFTSSFVGNTVGMAGMAAYAASKAGVVGLMKALAVEFGPVGIRINALLPGGTETDMARRFADTPEAMDFVRSLHALKRIASPDEIAKSALYLASDASSFTTGAALLVDGGVSISKG